MVGGAAVRPDVCPQLTTGATVRLVCTFSFPLLGAGFTVDWRGPSGLLAHCQGLWCWGSGVLAGVDWQGAGGGRGRLSLLLLWRSLQEGPCGTWRESDPPEGQIRRSTALGVCEVQASSLAGTGSLWDLGWGMGEGDGAGECLCSRPS